MPNKTIYVKPENEDLFKKAEDLSGKKFSDLVADLVKDYVLKAEEEGDLYAICMLDYTADDIPNFIPRYFIKTPVGYPISRVRFEVDRRIQLGMAYEDATVIYPLNNVGGEFEEQLKMEYHNREEYGLSVVELTNE
jgi:hypothetical protein